MADLSMAISVSGEAQAKAALGDLSKGLADVNVNLNQASQAGRAAGTGIAQAASTALPSVRSVTDALGQQVAQLRAQRDAMASPEYANYIAQQRKLREEIEAANPKAKSLGSSLAEVAGAYYLISQAAGVASRTVMSLVDATSKYELLHARMNATEGSSALGDRDFKMVQEMAKKPGLGFEEAASTMATLRGMKITAGEATQLINGIAQANASAGGTAEQFGRVMYQVRQSIGYGKLMQEDLRPILEAVPTLGAAIQEHFGSNQGEALNASLKKSGESVREFWLEVANMGAGMPATGETIANNMDNIRDSWLRLRAAMLDTGAVKSATAALGALLERLAVAQEKGTEEKSLRRRAQEQLGFGENLTYYKNLGERNPQIEAKMKELEEYDRANTLMLTAEKAAGDAQDRARADARKKAADAEAEARKNKKSGDSFKLQAQKNVIQNADGSVTMRDTEDSAGIAAHVRNMEKADQAADAIHKKTLATRQARMKQLDREIARTQVDELKAYAKMEEKKSEVLAHELKKQMDAYEKKSKVVEGYASKEVSAALQGNFTMTSAARSAKDTAIQYASEESVHWIAVQIEKMVFKNEIAAAEQAQAAAAQAAIVAESAATAAAVGLAWSGPAMLVSIGTAGASALAGETAFLQAMAASTIAAVPREHGGIGQSRLLVGERGAEFFQPATPGRIFSNSQTTNMGGAVTIHVHGGGDPAATAREIARILPRAQKAAQANRRQSSR